MIQLKRKQDELLCIIFNHRFGIYERKMIAKPCYWSFLELWHEVITVFALLTSEEWVLTDCLSVIGKVKIPLLEIQQTSRSLNQIDYRRLQNLCHLKQVLLKVSPLGFMLRISLIASEIEDIYGTGIYNLFTSFSLIMH